MVSFTFVNALSDNITTIIFFVLLALLMVVLLVVPMFTNKKRNKEVEAMHSSLRPGDVIMTVGGIIGTVKEIRQVSDRDKEMVIETGEGDNKSTLTFDVLALHHILSRAASPEANNTETVFDNAPVQNEQTAESEPIAPVVAEQPEEKVEEKQPEVKPDEPEVKEEVKEADAPKAEEPAVEKSEEPAIEQAAAADVVAEEKPAAPAKKPAAKKATSSSTKKTSSSSSGSKSASGAAKKPSVKKPIAKNK